MIDELLVLCCSCFWYCIGSYLFALLSVLCTGPIEGVSVGLPKSVGREGEVPLKQVQALDASRDSAYVSAQNKYSK
jgi:hypothetical protein